MKVNINTKEGLGKGVITPTVAVTDLGNPYELKELILDDVDILEKYYSETGSRAVFRDVNLGKEQVYLKRVLFFYLFISESLGHMGYCNSWNIAGTFNKSGSVGFTAGSYYTYRISFNINRAAKFTRCSVSGVAERDTSAFNHTLKIVEQANKNAEKALERAQVRFDLIKDSTIEII